jgi:hypothetical protein
MPILMTRIRPGNRQVGTIYKDALPRWAQPRASHLSYMDVPTLTTRRWATSRRTAAMSRGAAPSGRGVFSEVVGESGKCHQVFGDQMLTVIHIHMCRILDAQITLKSFGAQAAFKRNLADLVVGVDKVRPIVRWRKMDPSLLWVGHVRPILKAGSRVRACTCWCQTGRRDLV